MKYVTCDLSPKNDFSMKLTRTVAGSNDFLPEELGAGT
jgi:hypothetical protein